MDIRLDPSGGFFLTIPSTVAEGHTIRIPFSLTGLSLLRTILRNAEERAGEKIGSTFSPTQSMVDEWLRRDAEVKNAERLAALGDLAKIKLEI